jgi:hypothetical protein
MYFSQGHEVRKPISIQQMTTKIWIEQLHHPDGRPRYTSRGQLYRTRRDGPDGEVLCEQTVSPVCPSCRALMERGITGPFETWKEGMPYACMRGDVEKVAGLTVKEPDRVRLHSLSGMPFLLLR